MSKPATKAVALSEAELQRVSRAYEQREALREQRDDLIRQALAAGWSQTKISELTGLTRARIGQLAVRFPDRKNQRTQP